MTEKYFTIHTDGGARGNPGPAAIGAVIEYNGKVIERIAKCIGATTNNQAEYQAVHAALHFAQQHGASKVDLYADSELVVKQLRGEYKVKNKELAPWYIKIISLANHIGQVHYHTIRREENTAADALVNKALDRQALER
jgi:ribonuclease HI